eukprot:328089-Amphidinium_carterae.1
MGEHGQTAATQQSDIWQAAETLTTFQAYGASHFLIPMIMMCVWSYRYVTRQALQDEGTRPKIGFD